MKAGVSTNLASSARRWVATALFIGASHAHAAGNGIPLGEARLHPRVDVEGHYVVNPAFASKDAGPVEAAIARQTDFYLAAGPGLTVKLDTPKTALSLDGGIEYRRYFEHTELSTFAGEMSFGMEYNRNGAVTLRLSDNLVRYADGGNDSVTTRLLHTVNTAGLGLDFKPGGGALIINTDYRFAYDYYDRTGNTVPNAKALDSMRHQPGLRVAWKFLPRTAIFLQGTSDLTRYPHADAATNLDSNIVRAYLGLTGDVTARVKALVKAGYTNTLTGTENNLQTAVGQIELTYTISETANARFGFLRTVQPTTIYGFMSLDQAYAGYTQQFFGRTNLSAGVEYRHYNFGTPGPAFVVPSGLDNLVPRTDRADHDVVVRASLEYAIREWIGVGLFNMLDYRTSNDAQFGYLFNDTQVKLTLVY